MSTVDVVGIIVILFLIIRFWNVTVFIFDLFGSFLAPIAACIMFYRALGSEYIGMYEVGMVGAGVVTCIILTTIGVVGRFIQACTEGYEGLGLGDYIQDTVMAGPVSVIGAIGVLIYRLLDTASRGAAAEPFSVFFVKAALLCSMVTIYGWALLIIKARMTHGEEDLFALKEAPEPYVGAREDDALFWEEVYNKDPGVAKSAFDGKSAFDP